MRKHGSHRNGVLALCLFGMMFLTVGILVIVKPVYFASSGGIGPWASRTVTGIFGENESIAFGALFLMIAGFLFAVAHRLRSGSGKQ